MMKLNLGHYELPRRAEQRVGEQCRHRQIWVIFPRSANGLATVNVTLFSDVPGYRLIGGKGANSVLMHRGTGAADRFEPELPSRTSRDANR